MDSENAGSFETPVRRGSVVALVLERIKNAILQGELKPGDYLPSESTLVRNLGVGKTSIREAVKMLEAMGIVEVRQGQGSIIRENPGADAISPLIYRLLLASGRSEDLLELRMMFEPAYALIAMRKATPEQKRKLQEAVERLERHVEKNIQTPEDDLVFHETMLECTGNPYTIRIGKTILELFRYSVAKSMKTIPEVAVADHRAILDAFLAGDEQELTDSIVRSFRGWQRSLSLMREER